MKSSGVRQSKIYKSLLGIKGLKCDISCADPCGGALTAAGTKHRSQVTHRSQVLTLSLNKVFRLNVSLRLVFVKGLGCFSIGKTMTCVFCNPVFCTFCCDSTYTTVVEYHHLGFWYLELLTIANSYHLPFCHLYTIGHLKSLFLFTLGSLRWQGSFLSKNATY